MRDPERPNGDGDPWPADYFGEPEWPDEDDPDFQRELFMAFRALGWRPEDLWDRAFARKYAAWSKTTDPDV
jgi:hypothetical protein